MSDNPAKCILDTIEAFLDTHPDLEDTTIPISFPAERPIGVDFGTMSHGLTKYVKVGHLHYKVTVTPEFK